MASACGSPSAHGSSGVPRDGLAPASGVFGDRSVFRVPVAGAPVAASSPQLVAHLVSTIADRYGGVAAFNAHQDDPALVVAAGDQRGQDVAFDDCQGKGQEDPRLAAQLQQVPIPPDAQPAKGVDHELTVWQPSTDRLWELWRATRTATGWSACYGGRIDGVSASPAQFSYPFGATATGLPGVAGMIGIAEVRAGAIDHAVSLEVVDAAAGVHSWPAQRDDGDSHDPAAMPEGTRLRLDPSLDVTALHLTPIAAAIARAAQTYGFVVTDKSGAVAVEAEDPQAAVRATGTDPWAALERGVPDYLVLKGFPWSSLQVLQPDWGAPSR